MSDYMTAEEIQAHHAAGGRFVYADDFPYPWLRGRIMTDDEVGDAILAAQIRVLLAELAAALAAERSTEGTPNAET